MGAPASSTPSTWLERLGLGRPELRAWAMYDWANSAFYTIVITAVFPLFFDGLADAAEVEDARSTALFGYTTAASLTLIALLAPLLGALADHRALRKRMLAACVACGVLATGGMAFLGPSSWQLALVLFGLANAAAGGGAVFYDALLPHLAKREEVDRVSTAGYALGYVGGGLLLALDLFLIESWESVGLPSKGFAVRFGFFLVAVWWAIFTLPLLRRVPEPAAEEVPGTAGRSAALVAWERLRSTFAELRRYRQALLFLIAFLIYNDGVLTIMRFATIYGRNMDLEDGDMILAVLIVQFVGIPCAFLNGALATRIGAKSTILLGLLVYCGIALLGWQMSTAWHFYALAGQVALVQGGVQALSRSVFASMIPADKAAEFFGFFAVGEKFAGILGPLLFAGVTDASGDPGAAILAVASFFVVGGAILWRVDIEAGRRAVRTTA